MMTRYWDIVRPASRTVGQHLLNIGSACRVACEWVQQRTDPHRLPVISDFDHFGPGISEPLSVISDGDFGRCAVKSDGHFGRCEVNSDAAVNLDGDFGRCAVNSASSLVVFYITILVLISLISDGDLGQ